MDNNEAQKELLEMISNENPSEEIPEKLIHTYTKALSEMDKQLVLENLKNFTNFKEFSENILRIFKEETSELVNDNKESRQDAVKALNGRIDFLSQLALKEDIDEESRKEFVSLSIDLAKDIVQIHKDNQNFILKVLGIFAGVAGGLVTLLATATKIANAISDNESYEDIYPEVDDN